MHHIFCHIKHLCLLICFLLLCCPCFAQTLPLNNYSIQNGLPESTGYAVYIDAKGYLWTGTQSGACAFDGTQFRTYDSQSGLPDNHTTAISGTHDGVVWFGHRSGEISAFRNGTVIRFKSKGFKNNVNVNALLWQNNTLFVATAGNGLFAVTLDAKGYQTRHLRTNEGLAGDTVYKMCIKNDHELWIATNGGLSLVNSKTTSPVKISLPALLKQKVTAIAQSGNTLYCGAATGLIYYRNGVANPAYTNSGTSQLRQPVNAICTDHSGDTWLATNNGVIKLHGQQVKVFNRSNGLLSDIVYDLLEDREHGIWLAQYDGISCFKDSPFELYDHKDGLIYNETYAVTEDSHHQFWVGTAQGITVFAPSGNGIKAVKNITTKDGLPDNFIYNIFKDSHNNLWIACVNKGAACYLTLENKLISFEQKNGLAGKQVVGFNEDKKGRIWIATLDNGVACYDYKTNRITNFNKGNGFVANAVWNIHKDRKGQLWFGTRGHGLIKLDTLTDQFLTVNGQQDLTNHDFGSVSSDSKGNIWIATIGDGVYKYNGQTFRKFGSRNGIRSNNPYFIFCDRQDNIWIGTNTGLDHFDPIRQTTVNYQKSDGFIGIETNQNAVYQSANGDIWIGTVNGLMHYQSGNLGRSLVAPLTYITSEHLFFNEDSLVSRKLAYNQNYITFEYLG